MIFVMKLIPKLPSKNFFYSQIAFFIIGLALIFTAYYVMSLQYQETNNPFLGGPLTSLTKSIRLDLDQPIDETLVFDSSLLISGKTNPKKDVLIFTSTGNQVLQSKEDGSFSTILKLDEGVNKITVATFDQSGDSKSIERLVYYSKEKI